MRVLACHMNAYSLLEEKGFLVREIDPDAMVFGAVRLMDDYQVGALMVVEKDRLVVVISERDYTRKVVLKNRSSKNARVREIMTREPVTVSPRTDLEDCMSVMAERRIRHLPVAEQGHVLGVISSTDLLKLAIQQKDYVIEQLEQYIAPGP